MILKVDKKNSHLIASADDFISRYGAKGWLEKNIHLYEDLLGDMDGLNTIIKDFFAESKMICHVLRVENKWIVTVFKIPFAVATSKKVIPCQSIEKARRTYINIATERLKGLQVYENYPKDKVDFDVIKKMIEKENINLKLISE